MKKILLLAKDSFVARSIYPDLSKKYEVDTFSHKELDLTKLEDLRKVLDNKYYDFVINPAISGQGRLLKEDSCEDFYNNMLLLENILFLKDKYGKLITFASGAANNRNIDINNLKEGDVKEPPVSKYNLAKYLHDRRVFNLPFVINIRIFNVFGPLEKDNRFIKSCIKKYIDKSEEGIIIWGNAEFDFFYIEDLKTLIEYYIDNPPEKYEEINAVYEFNSYKEKRKFDLLDIANNINNLDNHKIDIKIIPNNINKNYTGSGEKLNSLNLPLFGLSSGIFKMYKELKNAK